MKKYILGFLVLFCLSYFSFDSWNKGRSLDLPDGAPEVLVSLKGVLRLKPCCHVEEDFRECWFLEMDKKSFNKALKTPVWGYALSIRDILKRLDRFDVQLGRDEGSEDFCSHHQNQVVTVQGHLFHAHTGHHHAPFLMSLEKIYE